MRSQSKAWLTLYQKRRAWYYMTYPFTRCFTLQTSDYDVIFDFYYISVINDVIQKLQRHHDLIKSHAVR